MILSCWVVLAFIGACRYVVCVCVCFKCLYVVDETAVVTAGHVFTVWYSITAY